MKKLKLTIIFLFFASCIFPISGIAATSVKVSGLQCEYMDNPLGIDVEKPRFSWKLTDSNNTRGQKQTAYRILVASTQQLLNNNQGDVWDSRKKSSEQSFLIPFGGQALTSGQTYFWKVQVFDKAGKASDWSEPARFATGLLHPEDWTGALWIKHPNAAEKKHIWFRKNFSLSAPVRSALIHVASVGYHELYVNGVKADDRVLAPALAHLPKRTLVVTYDIADLLQPGENVIAFWQASGWASYVEFKPPLFSCLRVRADITTTDNQTLTINSDTEWRCAVSNSENSKEHIVFQDNGGELIDARAYIPNWNLVGFDDSQWEKAEEKECRIELNSHALLDPTRIIETLQPVSITGTGTYKIDMGKNFTGWVKLDMSGLAAGDQVTIMASDDDKNACDFNQKSYFISAGGSKETFCNRFNYMAGRYITVEGLKQKPTLSDITGYALATDFKRTGHFTSSNDLFNRIYETDLWTFRANTIEGYTADCPHRERVGYGEVAFATAWGIGLPNYQSGGFYRKVLIDWADVQKPDGYIPNSAPHTFGWGGTMWSSAGVNVAREHYHTFGDKQVYEQYYPNAKRWLNFLHEHAGENTCEPSTGLLTMYTEHGGLFLGDWARPGDIWESGDQPQAQYFNNCVYALNLETVIEMAHVLGYSEDAARFEKRLKSLKERIHKTFFDPVSKKYSDGNQVQTAFALWTGVTPQNLIPDVTAKFQSELAGKSYLDMGSSGLPVLLNYLVEHPENAAVAAHHLNQKTQPSYGYFLERGETAWPEYWSVDVDSKIHTCYTGIASWFVKSLCGIQPDPANPGYKTFIIRPAVVTEVNFAEATVESPYGTIYSRWERTGNQVNLSVTVPPNSKATVYIPFGDVVSVEAGQYSFTSIIDHL